MWSEKCGELVTMMLPLAIVRSKGIDQRCGTFFGQIGKSVGEGEGGPSGRGSVGIDLWRGARCLGGLVGRLGGRRPQNSPRGDGIENHVMTSPGVVPHSY